MAEKIIVPNIGDFQDVEIIEVLVKAGDVVAKEQPLLTLESDKATMEVPSPRAGTVVSVSVRVGDKVSEGSVIGEMEDAGDAPTAADAPTPAESTPTPAPAPAAAPPPPALAAAAPTPAPSATPPAATGGVQEIRVPNIGDFENVEIIEVLVKVGDDIAAEQPLLTLESDKATMEVPSPVAGRVQELRVNTGDRVSEGSVIATVAASGDAAPAPAESTPAPVPAATPPPPAPVAAPTPTPPPAAKAPPQPPVRADDSAKPYAGPAVRRFARELGVNLAAVRGSGRKGRILRDDVTAHVKATMSAGQESGFSSYIAVPETDFRAFGEVEMQPLSRINKLSAAALHRNWLAAPPVTQFAEADITDMEDFRKSLADEAKKNGYKMTPIVFLIKAAVAALREFPRFNASLLPDGETLVLKKYHHIGVAVDTPNGLVVPVVRDAGQKGLADIARELADLSVRAREGKLKREDMQGGCFTISSLGGIGGTAFTPILNLPEVAILGVSRSELKPHWDAESGAFVPRLKLPLSLSYDHRVIDGADGARFVAYYAALLGDIRRLTL